MRIAYLCHRIPYPPNKGDKLRAFHQLRAMAERGHEVDLFTLADDPTDLGHIPALSTYCRNVTVRTVRPAFARLRSPFYLPTQKPLTLPYFHSAELAAALKNALRTHTYDRIFVYCSAMMQYVTDVTAAPVITDLVDVDSDKWRQYSDYSRFPMSWIYRREARLLSEYERSVCLMSSAAIVATEREACLLRAVCPNARVHVITNGVNADAGTAGILDDGPPVVVFAGDMAYFPNAHAVDYFARQVFSRVRASVPATRFVIVGRNPGPTVRKLSSLPGVEVTGTVPDVGAYLAGARVSVAPFLISAGIPNKILEAMMCGLPVVATSRAVQGLHSEVAAHVATADNADNMARVVSGLLRDAELARRAGAAGRRAVSATYSWTRSLGELIDLVESSNLPAGLLRSA